MTVSKRPKKTILILDTDADIREGIKWCLNNVDADVTVLESNSAADGIMQLRNRRVDLLIVDIHNIHLANTGGSALLNAFPVLEPEQIPDHTLIFSEILSDEATRFSTPALSYLSKPLKTTTLTPHLRKILVSEKEKKVHLKVDIQVFNQFIFGMELVFRRMAEIEIKKDRIYLRKSESLHGDVAAVIALRNNIFDGQLVIIMNKESFFVLAEKVFSESITTIHEDTADAVMEVANQVYGHAKRELNNHGFGFPLAIPTLLRDPLCEFPPPGPKQLFITVPFKFDRSGQQMEVILEIQVTEVFPEAVIED